MEITNVSVNVTAKRGTEIKAYASILIDKCFAIKNIRIIKRENGYLVAMPSRKVGNGVYEDVAHPINHETRQMVSVRILNKFFEEVQSLIQVIERPQGYYLGASENDIHSITLYREEESETRQGEEIGTYVLEDFSIETLKTLEAKIKEKVRSEE